MNIQSDFKKINAKEVQIILKSSFKHIFNEYLKYVKKLELTNSTIYKRQYFPSFTPKSITLPNVAIVMRGPTPLLDITQAPAPVTVH